MSWLFGGDEAAPPGDGDGDGDLASDASALLGSFMNLAAQVGEAVKDSAEKATEAALTEFTKEQKKFVESKKLGGGGTSLAPWVGYEDEDELKVKILALSKDKRNFMRDPPTGQSAFVFSMDRQAACAAATLQEDPSLEKMRSELVPKILTENKFWENYFYRVALIKSSSDVSAMAGEGSGASEEPAVEAQGLNAAPPVEPATAATPAVEDVDESTLNAVNDSLQMNDMEEEEELSQNFGGVENVSLDELGGGLGETEAVPPAASTSEDSALAGEDDTGEEADGQADDDDLAEDSSKPSSIATTSPSEIQTDTSATWEKDLEAELEGFSEFEAGEDDTGADEELDAGWEDEVAQMLEDEAGAENS